MLKQRPFRSLLKPEEDDLLQKAMYHSHRLTELLHKLDKVYEKNKKFNPLNSTVINSEK